MQEGHLPAFYAYPGCLQMRQEDGDALLTAKLDTLDDGLAAGIPNYMTISNSWKMALLDMAYNLGAEGLLKGYPRMLAAVQAGDGQMASVESHRNGIGDDRNAWTRQQFTMEA